MGLDEYHRKRDFARTPEPRGRQERGREGFSFVIQKHAATRLHYDFRLELDGVLKSWAVPKGPSFDPAEKRLAMETEDHPIEYGDFEGIIPEGQYGGGTVLLWDRGSWEPIEEPRAGYAKGRLKFRLQGEKLQGGWTLVRIKSRDPRERGKSWLLIKERDQTARTSADYDVTEALPLSVATRRSMEQIARERDRVWQSHVKETPSRRWRPLRPPSPPAVDPAAVPGAKRGALPGFSKPQLATLVDEAPQGDRWLHEIKFDGYRILCRREAGQVKLISRNGKDWTEVFPSVARAAARLPCRQALLDGEVAVVLPDGTTSFNALQNAMEEKAQERLVYFAFDLLHLDGHDLTASALEERKGVLRDLLAAADTIEPIRYSDHVVGGGDLFFEQACRMKLEGIVSKLRGEAYRSGRSRGWLKVKCVQEQEFVIGGFTEPEGRRAGLGALLLGVYEGEQLRYVGKVGTGFTDRMARDLRRRLDGLEAASPPFATRPGGMRGAHWVSPRLVAEVEFSEWTPEGKLRHPSFKGLREDKPAREIVREAPASLETVAPAASARPRKKRAAAAEVTMRPASARPRKRRAAPAKRSLAGSGADGGSDVPARPLRSSHEKEGWAHVRAAKARRAREAPAANSPRRGPSRGKRAGSETEIAGVRITNPDRVIYPAQGVTKRELAEFYEAIADWIVPHLMDRPTTLVRCPEGVGEPCFYQKHTGYWAPSSLRRSRIREKTKVGEYLVVDDLPGLIGLVQMGILEIHTWNSRTAHLEQPDRLVFDLDPAEDVPWTRVVEAARLLRDELRGEGLESWVKTTGGKGLHVVAPIEVGPDWDACLEYARSLAERISAERPREYLASMSKAQRVGRIFIDYLRNLRGSTSISAYSTRAKPQAPVSTPVHWDELGPRLRPDQFTIRNLRSRLASLREDPWKGYAKRRQRLPGA